MQNVKNAKSSKRKFWIKLLPFQRPFAHIYTTRYDPDVRGWGVRRAGEIFQTDEVGHKGTKSVFCRMSLIINDTQHDFQKYIGFMKQYTDAQPILRWGKTEEVLTEVGRITSLIVSQTLR